MPKKKEKLSRQFSLTCAAGAIAIVGVVSYMAGIDLSSADFSLDNTQLLEQLGNTSLSRQLKVIYLGFPSAIILSILGYIMGDILDNPRGRIPDSVFDNKSQESSSGRDPSGSSRGTAYTPTKPSPIITGDELFLDDLDFGEDLLESSYSENSAGSEVSAGK